MSKNFKNFANEFQKALCQEWHYEFYNEIYETIYLSLLNKRESIWDIIKTYELFYWKNIKIEDNLKKTTF